MTSELWQAREPALTELGVRAERALRFSRLSDPWVEIERHDPDDCACYLLPVFFNHVAADLNDGRPPCQCMGCREVRERWGAGWRLPVLGITPGTAATP